MPKFKSGEEVTAEIGRITGTIVEYIEDISGSTSYGLLTVKADHAAQYHGEKVIVRIDEMDLSSNNRENFGPFEFDTSVFRMDNGVRVRHKVDHGLYGIIVARILDRNNSPRYQVRVPKLFSVEDYEFLWYEVNDEPASCPYTPSQS